MYYIMHSVVITSVVDQIMPATIGTDFTMKQVHNIESSFDA